MINDEGDEVFQSLKKKKKSQNALEFVKSSEIVFNYVHLLYCKCHKITFNRGGSYTDSPYWIKHKKGSNKSYQ